MAIHDLAPGVYKLGLKSEGKDRVIVKCRDGRRVVTREQLELAEKDGKAYWLTVHPDGTRTVEYGTLIEKATAVVKKSKEPKPEPEEENGDIKTPTDSETQRPLAN